MAKLFLLDGMALVYRAHFVFLSRPIRNSKGLNTSAVYGFTNTLVELIEKEKPTHLAVAFDTQAPTARHREYEAYKAQREEMPEDLVQGIPLVKDMLQAFRIPVLELDGYEADDIIGTLARQAEQAGFEIFMVTPDKDFGQLVTEHIRIFKPGRQGNEVEILGPAEVCARWNIQKPEQVIELLGLMGDASDNIPGVPGIGEKTAAKLIGQYGTVENLLAHAADLKGRQRETLEAHVEMARLSRRLATINCAVPLKVSMESLQRQEPDAVALQAIFAELEFNSLARRVLGGKSSGGKADRAVPEDLVLEGESIGIDAAQERENHAAPKNEEAENAVVYQTIQDVPHEYERVLDETGRKKLMQELRRLKAFCFDTETDGLNPREARLLGISFSWEKGRAFYMPLPEEATECAAVLAGFAEIFAKEGIEKTGHNLKFDLEVLQAAGLEVAGPFFDTMIAHALVEPEQRHGMDHLAEVYLGYRPVPITALIGEKGEGQKSMALADPVALAEYAAEDADVTWQLRGLLLEQLEKSGQHRVFYEVEMPLLPALVAMEQAGVAIDLFALEEFSGLLAVEIDRARRDVYGLAGREFNMNSPKQLGAVLFDELKLVEKPKKTKTGQYKTDEQVLQELAALHPIIERLLDYREANKLKSTYVDALPNAVSKKTGRVHTTFQQAATTTGRLASSDPNLQNIPVRTELGREIRKAFVPGQEGDLILSADYSQIELRIIAAVSGDPSMIAAFEKNIDIHSATAARVFGVGLDGVTPDMRRKAKMVNFGISYGISAFGLAQRLAIPRTEAASIIDNYFQQFPGIRKYIEDTGAFCRRHGYVETLSGRRRYLPDINSANQTTRAAAERNAINMPIQGTAADMIKTAMGTIHREFSRLQFRSRMLLQIHDELVFELVPREEKAVRSCVEEGMKNALPALTKIVPIEVEIGTGKNWLEAH